jgi:tetratricopeptide (TPR) repeat protein
MATDDKQPITFAVPGQSGLPVAAATRGGAAAAVALPGQVKASVRVGALRDGGAPQRLTAVPDEDIVALHIQDGPVLLLHPATARDLMQGAADRQRGTADVPVQAELAWPGAYGQPGDATTRDLAGMGRIVVSAFQVLTGLVKDKAADFAAGQVVQRVDGQVDAGVYALQPDRMDKLKGSIHKRTRVDASPDPMLVLLHGTFVDTTSTFQKLWLGHRAGVDRLFTHYSGAVYALDHPTLGASPIANARTLVDALPDGARLHLATHSRGGLVAEVLARVIGSNGVLDADLAFFNDPVYEPQRLELRALGEAVKGRGLRVERVVRVACPARGTLLAAKRLDAYLSVLQWTLQLAGVPVAPAFVDFVGEVARRRADPSLIPGLAAMMPGTPLIDWLNAAPQALPGDLRVVAGDLQRGSTVGSWLKALLADAYYWTDNDIVVQTRSMYGGAPRAGGASFLLDQGPQSTHFNYFANQTTADAVVDALISVAPPAGFKAIGPLSWAGEDASGERGASVGNARSAPDANKPAVFVLPGILGSHLKQGLPPHDDRIWLGPRLLGGFDRLTYQPGGADHVADDGPIGLVYDKLLAYLETTHEVIPFGFDWRRPIEEEAQRLAERMRHALDVRKSSGQPVRVLAHSMGGLLARTVQLVAPDVWGRLMAHADARLVMLGTPNGGSWAPMQVLSGDDTFGNALTAIGSPFANRKARTLMARMPGFLQLQAGLLDRKLALDQEATWQQLAQDDFRREQERSWWQRYAGDVATAAYEWGVPPQAVLDQARALRTKLDTQLAGALKTSASKMRLVVGHAKSTPDGFELGSDGLVYLDLQDGGDGRVPLASALLPGVATWTLDCEHGSLPSAKQAFDAFADLLARGSTSRLPPLAATRDAAAAAPVHLRSRPSRRPTPQRPAGGIAEVMGSAPADPGTSSNAPDSAITPRLLIQVLNGNLTFVQQPLMLGHYRSLELTGTEAVVDGHLGGAMNTALAAGLYPDAPGSQRIFVNTQKNDDNPWQLPRPQAAIVIGLGEEGTLDGTKLADTVCQGVKAWAQRASEDGRGGHNSQGTAAGDGIELAATLIGSGGLGITPGGAARAIARGVCLANQRMAGTPWPRVRKLTLVEWYLDRAGDAWRGLRVLAQASPGAFEVAPTITSGTGPLRRQPESGYRGADYDLINTTTAIDGTISFALDTRRARTEVRAQRIQPLLVGKLIKLAATARSSDPHLGSTLFQLLVPMELKPFLSGNDRVVLQLDAGTAPIPWELLETTLDDSSGGAATTLPWAIRTKLLRKLSVADFRERPRDAHADAAVLVIGEPLTTGDSYPPLPGARSEAAAVVQQLTGAGGIGASRVTALLDAAPFDAIIMALMARPYRIVHVAGHGAPVQMALDGKTVLSRGGVVLSEGVFLGPDEIEKLPDVPELVFVNCCHLGEIDGSGPLKVEQPVAFAAGVAESLIKIGVRCVVAAGWAVDDRPAEVFAQAFYRTLLAGQPFFEAVAAARTAAREAAPNSKTWAAYQCYGDPNWVFETGVNVAQDDAQAPARVKRDEFDGLASAPGLALALESLATRARFYNAKNPDDAAAQRKETQRQVRGLQDRYAEQWGGMGAVAEALAVAWDAAGDTDQAIAWYGHALQANDASASMKAHEQYGNLRARKAWDAAQGAEKGSATLDAARQAITEALRDLLALAALQPTIERLSLCGSAWKRLAQLEERAGDTAQYRAALAMAAEAYGKAQALAIEQHDPHQFYPGGNRAAIELALHAGDPAWSGLAEEPRLLQLRSLQAKHATDPDFWSSVALIETDLFHAMAQRQLAGSTGRLRDAYADLNRRVPSRRYWGSVADQARFVMTPYLRRVDATEQRAARSLLGALEGYAA